MAEIGVSDRPLTQLHPLRRNRFFYGKLMGVMQFGLEQQHAMALQMLVSRTVLTPGVICGLSVSEITVQGQTGIRIGPGMALDGWGRLIVVPANCDIVPLSLTDGGGQPTNPGGQITWPIHVNLCYQECLTDYAPALTADPVCNGPRPCEGGTWVESFYVTVLDRAGPPVTRDCAPGVLDLIKAGDIQGAMCSLAESCVPESDDPCLVLANISQGDGSLTIEQHLPRTIAPSNGLLLDLITCLAARVEECCAQKTATSTLRVSNVRLVTADTATGPSHEVAVMDNPVSNWVVRGAAGKVNAIEITFEAPAQVDFGTVNLNTFSVAGPGIPPGIDIAPPEVGNLPLTNSIRYLSHRPFVKGNYRVGLSDKVLSKDGTSLDGEFHGATWPTGEGTPGGAFGFELNLS